MKPENFPAAALRAARAHRKLTQVELAERADVSEATVSALEAGKDARLSAFLKVCAALQLRPRLVLEED